MSQSKNAASVAGTTSGDFVVVWQSYYQDGDYEGVFGRRVSSAGAAIGGEFQVNAEVGGDQRYPKAAGLNSGGFVVVWVSQYALGAFDNIEGVVAQRFDSNGNPLADEFSVLDDLDGLRHRNPAVAADADGGFVIVWDEEYSGQVQARRFDSAGGENGSELVVGTGRRAGVGVDQDGDFAVTWQDGDGSSNGIFAARYLYSGSAVGSPFHVNEWTTGFPAIRLRGHGSGR